MAANRVFEVVFIIDMDASADDVTRITNTLQQVVADQGGTITKNESMGRRKLAYPINRKMEGTYTLFEIEGSGQEIAELERRMRVTDQIVRFITVRVDEERQRAEKFRARRTRKAAKRPLAASATERNRSTASAAAAATTMADMEPVE